MVVASAELSDISIIDCEPAVCGSDGPAIALKVTDNNPIVIPTLRSDPSPQSGSGCHNKRRQPQKTRTARL